jgi:hypothetical protein
LALRSQFSLTLKLSNVLNGVLSFEFLSFEFVLNFDPPAFDFAEGDVGRGIRI